jgi:hypothetical protein
LYGDAVSAIVGLDVNMKQKVQLRVEPVIPREMLEQAKRSVSPDRLTKAVKCSVCGAEASDAASEPLCWVCRRLKISAWHESEQQMPAQE